jgi:hypothetical protein
MDRRKRMFRPTLDGLEVRLVMSGSAGGAAASAVKTTAVAAPAAATSGPGQVINNRNRYINNLGNLMLSNQPGRIIPPDVVQQVQNALLGIRSQLKAPTKNTTIMFQKYLRLMNAQASINPENLRGLDQSFQNILIAAGANRTQRAAFTSAMARVAQVDSNSLNPGMLVASDYGLIFQAVMSVGRKLPAPVRPQLLPADDTGDRDNVTKNTQPRFYGNYAAGFQIRLLNSAGHVIGVANTSGNGDYQVKPAVPLGLGTYQFRVQAVELSNGDLSLISSPTKIKIVS